MLKVPEALRTGLTNYWYPVLTSADLPAGEPFGVTRLGRRLVLWRDASGLPVVQDDRCPHRGASLSLGNIVRNRLQCRYHGLQFDTGGQCRLAPMERMEDGPAAQAMRVETYPVQERSGLIYAFLSEGGHEVRPFPDEDELDETEWVSIARTSRWEANWLLVRDNTPDPGHLPFLHGSLVASPSEKEGLAFDLLPGVDRATMPAEAVVGLIERKLLVQDTPRGGIVVQREGLPAPEVEWVPPSLAKVVTPFGGHMVSHLQYEVPIDDQATQIFSIIGVRADPHTPRPVQLEFLRNAVWPVFQQAFAEDSWMIQSQGDVEFQRSTERLLPSDFPMIRVRRRIRELFEENAAKGEQMSPLAIAGAQ